MWNGGQGGGGGHWGIRFSGLRFMEKGLGDLINLGFENGAREGNADWNNSFVE